MNSLTFINEKHFDLHLNYKNEIQVNFRAKDLKLHTNSTDDWFLNIHSTLGSQLVIKVQLCVISLISFSTPLFMIFLDVSEVPEHDKTKKKSGVRGCVSVYL